VLTVDIPPLRERREDIPVLAEHFAQRWATAYNRPSPSLSDATMEKLMAHGWSGNVRELENVVHRAVIEIDGSIIEPHHLALDPLQSPAPTQLAGRAWDDVQKELIVSTLAQVGGNRKRAAELMGMAERTLRNRLREYREATQA
jgi:DNA-binding NtrC family response regulator